MTEKEYFIDDRCIIPDDIKKMTREERQAAIKKLEAEALEEKKKLLKTK
jgi:hypothetical protein